MNPKKWICGIELRDDDGNVRTCKATIGVRKMRGGLLYGEKCEKCGHQPYGNFTPVGLEVESAPADSSRRGVRLSWG